MQDQRRYQVLIEIEVSFDKLDYSFDFERVYYLNHDYELVNSVSMSKAPRPEHLNVEKEESSIPSVKVIESDMLNLLYSRGRKYFLRLKRNNTGTGIEKPYEDFYKQLGISRDEADKLFYKYLKKKYPDLVKLIRSQMD